MRATRFVIAAASAALAFVAFAVPAFATPGTMRVSANMFAQPDTSTIPVATLGAGQPVDVAGCNSSWCQVSAGGASGWVSKNAITFQGILQPRNLGDGPAPQPQPPRPPRPGNNDPGFSFDFNFGNGNPGPFPPQRPRPPRPQQSQACFYSSTNFRGDSFCVGRGESYDYLPGDWDDRIRSVEVFGRARVDLCRDEDLEGACVTLRDSQSRLPRQLDRRASSLEVY